MAQGFESKGCGALQCDRSVFFKAASQRPARCLFEIRPASWFFCLAYRLSAI
jgi:hypothetical protein